MYELGWCNTGHHEKCWAVVKHTMGILPYSVCECICHRKEKHVVREDKQTAIAERIESPTADIMLTLKEGGGHSRTLPMTWEGAHAARDAMAQLLHEHAGRSIVMRLEDDLDGVMDVLMDTNDSDEMPLEQGWARGLALAISYMRGCDVELVKEQAMERYEERTAS